MFILFFQCDFRSVITTIYDDDSLRNQLGLTIIAFKTHVLMPLMDVRYFMRDNWFDSVKQLFQHVNYFEQY